MVPVTVARLTYVAVSAVPVARQTTLSPGASTVSTDVPIDEALQAQSISAGGNTGSSEVVTVSVTTTSRRKVLPVLVTV